MQGHADGTATAPRDRMANLPYAWCTIEEAVRWLATRGFRWYTHWNGEWLPPTPDLVRQWCKDGHVRVHQLGKRAFIVYLPDVEQMAHATTLPRWLPPRRHNRRRRRSCSVRVPCPPASA